MLKKKASAGQTLSLPRNPKGGVLFDAKALEPAWQMLCQDCDKKDGIHFLNAGKVRQLMCVLYPSITLKEVQWILGHREAISFDQLLDLIRDNVLEESVDPIKEAFMHLCEDGQDSVHLDTVLNLFDEMGTTGLNIIVMEKVYDKMLQEETIMEVTWRQQLDEPLPERLMDHYNEKEGRKKKKYTDRIIIRDKDGDSVEQGVFKNEEMREIDKLTIIPEDRFPIKVHLKDPLRNIPEHARENREITLDMFRQLVSYGQDAAEDDGPEEFTEAGAKSMMSMGGMSGLTGKTSV